MIKYGISKFKLEILVYCSPKKCIEIENYWINLFNPEYNISKVAGASMLGRNHSDQTRAKMSATRMGIGKGTPKP